MKPVIGFVGLGNMGFGMASNVLKEYPLVVYDINPEPMESLARLGAKKARDLEDLCNQAEGIITMLPGSPQVESVYLGSSGLVAFARSGQTYIDMSTCLPTSTMKVGQALAARGAEMLDAPVARTKQAAVKGTLSIMVGGNANLVDRWRDLLQTMGTDISHCGELGTGEVVKLVNNMILFNNIASLAECLPLAQALGVEPGRLVNILQAGSADSYALHNHIPNSVLRGDFAPGKFSVDYALKDVNYALNLADGAGLPMYQALVTKARLLEAASKGLSQHYYTVLFELSEALTGHEFRGRSES